MRITVTPRQKAFLQTEAFEVLYGGAAGGGKSYGQAVDALLYALRYPGSRQLVLRRTYPELERSLLRVVWELYPREVFRYVASRHEGRFTNGSVVEFASLEGERDVYKFQSAEYDVVRFDELTHFTEEMYLYLLSRIRGTNGYPKAVKSTSNPGGVGHSFVKARFIDPAPPGEEFGPAGARRIFLPATVADNPFLQKSDPYYKERLRLLPERERRALLEGCWDLFEGQYFTEFDRGVHVVEPFEIPGHWRRYRSLDYGLDMLACLFVALDERGRAYVYREIYEPDLIVSKAAGRILEQTREPIRETFAPPDLWARQRETGRSSAEIFASCGVPLCRAQSARESGWLEVKEWLAVKTGEQGERTADLKIFSGCRNLIRTLPALLTDPANPNDAARTPHELTHAPDALRYFLAGRPRPARVHAQAAPSFFTPKRTGDALGRGERIRVV